MWYINNLRYINNLKTIVNHKILKRHDKYILNFNTKFLHNGEVLNSYFLKTAFLSCAGLLD